MDWNKVYEAYPVNQKLIWLNNCGTVPAGSHAVEPVKRFLDGYAQEGVLTKAAGYAETRDAVKSILARLLGSAPEELVLVHHTAEGMNYISHGLDLAPGDEIIVLENEYPSNYYPWLHWLEKDVNVVTTPMESTPDGFFDRLTRLITPRTRVISLSAVHWCTGMPLPLARIGKICAHQKIEFVVDGAQGVGMQPIHVKKAGISYMAFSAWKWLMGPLGLGVLYVPNNRLEKLKPAFIGTQSVVRDEEYLPYKSTLKASAERFCISTPNFNDWVYFKAALDYLDELGFANVRNRLYELSEYLKTELRKLDFKLYCDHFPHLSTAIVVCQHPHLKTGRVLAHLKKHGVVAAERLGRIRFSPHIYISRRQLDDVIYVLKQL